MPRMSAGLTPTRFTAAAATFAQMIAVPATARYATPVLHRRVAEHLLHVERQHQEHGEHRRAHDETGDVRRRERLQPEDRERNERIALPLLPERERDEQRAGGDEDADRLRRGPAPLPALRDAEDEQ